MTINPSPPAHQHALKRVLKLAAILVASLFLFVVGLELLKSGTSSLTTSWFKTAGSTSLRGALGAGWLMACLVLSGSPVAAIALGLHNSGDLDVHETYAMIIGSRLGAAFVVLVIGFLYDRRARKGSRGGVYVGALALLTTAVVYVPAFFVGLHVLDQGWFDGVRFGPPQQLVSILDLVIKPVAHAIGGVIPDSARFLLSLLGIGLIVCAFKLFDGFLPVIDPTGGKLSHMATTIYRPWITFLFGMLVTCITLSVSVSLTLLVPLTARGLVRRENLIPYILGANITTFVDTLFATLLLKQATGFTVVFCAMSAVTAISLPLVLWTYRPFERCVDSMAQAVTQDRTRLGLFVVALFLIPLFLIWLK